ncbi:MAG: HAD-IA family hydrolase [Bacteroides sp.]|nr:HAD-IA family hydrolase [Bacteroides sp.]
MKYSTYLFDFDYTLADSSVGIVICFQNVLRRHDFTHISDENIKRTIGKTLEDSFAILTSVTDTERILSWKKEYTQEAHTYMTPHTFLYPDTIPVLTGLKERGAKIGIISTKYRFRIREKMDLHFPEDFFDIIVGGEDVQREKPDPQGIRFAMEQLGTAAQNVLYIGDSIIDAETARNAGVDFIGVTTGMTGREELACYPHLHIIGSLKELLHTPSGILIR